MILCASGPVFQTQTVLNSKDDPSVRFQMSGNDLQKIHIWIFALNISLPVLEHTDQGNIIVFLCEIFLDLLEISHQDLKILLVSVAVGIDTAALHGKIDTCHLSCIAAQRTCDSTAACTHFQDLLVSLKRNPA